MKMEFLSTPLQSVHQPRKYKRRKPIGGSALLTPKRRTAFEGIVTGSTSPGQTKKIGKFLVSKILKTKGGKAVIVGLEGDLGGGKTTFLQGFAKGLGIKQKILSPTFIIIKRFKVPRGRVNSLRGKKDLRIKNFYHIDCYRIQKPKEISDLGFKEIIANPQNIVAIEWADRIQKIIPEDAIWINFEFINAKTRKITIN